jgi:septum formation protein
LATLILASTSPRRHLLLKLVGIPHEIDAVPIDESVLDGESPASYVSRVARAKASAVAERHPDCLVLGADTAVTFDGSILGKPKDARDAESMLHQLAGRSHEVLTAVALVEGNRVELSVETTKVWMRTADQSLIHDYVATGEPLDKAGAYAAQGVGALLIDHIDGDFFNVMGLPLRRVLEMLESEEKRLGG